jgi:hypothetical protein
LEVVCPPPFRAACLRWQARPGAFAVTVVCKATFRLQPGTATLLDSGEPVLAADEPWSGDAAGRSLRAPSDLVPFKPRADVLLVGSAFSPRKEPARSLIARLIVGEVDKSITVVTDRFFHLDGSFHEGGRFVQMPLRWERAAGGPGTTNPVGVWMDGPRDSYGRRALPNLEPPGNFSLRPDQPITPIGFGPIAASWPGRRDKLGRLAAFFPTDGSVSADTPLPEDLAPAYFNAAPPDQQLDELRVDERIILENLHPAHARLVTALPALYPHVWIERARGHRAVSMRPDTLWIDTDHGICTLTFRGSIGLDHPAEALRFVVAQDARPPADEPVAENAPQMSVTLTGVLDPRGALPFGRTAAEAVRAVRAPAHAVDSFEELSAEDMEETYSGHPGAPSSPAEAFDQDSDIATMASDTTEPSSKRAALPFVAAASAVSPPPLIWPKAPAEQAPPPPASPWAASSAATTHAQVPAASLPPLRQSHPTLVGVAPEVAQGAALAASNNAAAVTAPPEKEEPAFAPRAAPAAEPRPAQSVIVKLLYFDPARVEQVRARDDWRLLFTESRLRQLDKAEEEGAPEPPPMSERSQAKRDIIEVLVRADITSLDAVGSAFQRGVKDDGRFEAPLVVLAGDLEMPFDELSTLKATVAAMRPLSAGDKRLTEALDAVDELVKTPWLEGSSGVSENLFGRVREAFVQAKRAVSLADVEAHTERMLLERRCYQTRSLFGKKWLRGLLRGGTGEAPVYLPESLREELPMFKRFAARLIAEVEPREDQYEKSAYALKTAALGRVVQAG